MNPLPTFSLGEFGIREMRVDLRWRFTGEQAELRVVMFPAKDVLGEDQEPMLVFRRVLEREFVERIDARQWRHIVRAEIIKALAHEVDEWLLCDGVLVTEPHPEAKPGG